MKPPAEPGSANSARALPLPPVLSRLLRGTFWLALRMPLQAVTTFVSVPFILAHIGEHAYGAYGFAWGFGFLQFLLEFGMSSALQRQVSDGWTRGDRAAVRRTIACGLNFYAVMAFIQAAALLGIAYFAVPDRFGSAETRLIVKLLWLQAITAPCYGLSTVVSSVLQAARRYEFIPKFELLIIILRFAILIVGLSSGVDFFLVVVAQIVVQVVFSLGPALWVVVRELDFVPRFAGARWEDYKTLTHISVYMFLIQLSVVLADRIDTTILGYALENPGPAISIYQTVSRPFTQLRQAGWMLAHLVMPAVASLAAANDLLGLERVKYDGPRLLIGALLPIGLLAIIYAHPFLALWVPPYAQHSGLMQLFLVATLPLVLAVNAQMAIGLGHIRVIALAALAGSLINLPVSYALTVKLGVAGVIWGTVLTTLFSNLIVPGIHVFRVLEVRISTFLARSLGAPFAGSVCLVAATWIARGVLSPEPASASVSVRAAVLIAHLSVGCIAYVAGYALVASGRGDLMRLIKRSATI